MRKSAVSLFLVFILTVLCFGFCGNTLNINEEVCLDEADKCFFEYLSVDAESGIKYNRTELFDENFERTGWSYDFTLNEQKGYALLSSVIINSNSMYEVEEFSLGKNSPFAECKGIPVYITKGVYIDFHNDRFVDLAEKTIVAEEDILMLSQRGFGYSGDETNENEDLSYSGGGEAVNTTELIEYDHKTVDEYSINGNLPNYYGQVGSSNCANVAGAVTLGYYDRMFENLIPDYKTYTKLGSVIKYRGQSAEIEACMDTLYQLMGTDVNQIGTTYSGFQNGMQQYVSAQGYTYNYESVLSLGALDLNKFALAVENGKPVALFLPEYTIVQNIVENENSDLLYAVHIQVSHVTIACGYKVERYYNANGIMIDERTYLKVASGFFDYGIAYLSIDDSTVDHAIEVTIS